MLCSLYLAIIKAGLPDCRMPDFLVHRTKTENILTDHKMYQMGIKIQKGLHKYTKIWTFGMQIYHLAALLYRKIAEWMYLKSRLRLSSVKFQVK
jgi:hypothetical protein